MTVRVFISAVTGEGGSGNSVREWLAGELKPAGIHCVFQECLPDRGVNTLVKLAEAIDRECDFVIHVIGDDSGTIPPIGVVGELLRHCGEASFRDRFPVLFTKDVETGCTVWQRLTYTQWEAWLGAFYKRRVLSFRPSASRSTNIAESTELTFFDHFRLLSPVIDYPTDYADRSELLKLVLRGLFQWHSTSRGQHRIDWPNPIAPKQRSIANRHSELQYFFDLISGECPEKVLLIYGPSNRGKSTLLKEFEQQLQSLSPIVCCSADFKGGVSLEAVVEQLIESCGLLTTTDSRPHDPIEFLYQLDSAASPIVILLDTYEVTIQPGGGMGGSFSVRL